MSAIRRTLARRAPVAALGLLGFLLVAGCGGSSNQTAASAAPVAAPSPGLATKVTFVELGSNKCIPCKQMRPVMEAIARDFGDQVNVVFYDVWKNDAPAKQYHIQFIPTQVFLDEQGTEFHRHVGFYPQADIEELLLGRGLQKATTQ